MSWLGNSSVERGAGPALEELAGDGPELEQVDGARRRPRALSSTSQTPADQAESIHPDNRWSDSSSMGITMHETTVDSA